MQPIRVLSLFDGIACGYQALKNLGIPVECYDAFEIDKYAIQIAKKNHPTIRQHGSVVGADFTWFKGYDLILGGSPCQGFSFAGKQLAFDDPRSRLFFEFVRALKEVQPQHFLLENVKMKKEHEAVISEFIGVHPVLINSALVSAQNRKRLYWCNWKVEQPEDRGILLKDIIEHGVTDRDKSYRIDANCWKGGNLEQYFEKNRRQLVFGAAQCGRYIVDGKRQDHKMKTAGLTEQRIELGGEKSNALTSVQKDSLVAVYEKPHGFNAGGWKNREKFNTLRHCTKDNYFLDDGITIRKLTSTECERLQTLPDGYTEVVEQELYMLYTTSEIPSEVILCDVKSTDANGKYKLIDTVKFALCIIKDMRDIEVLSYQRERSIQTQSVNIVIDKSGKKEVGQEDYVIDITRTGYDMDALYTQIKYALNLDHEAMKKGLLVKTSTDLSWRITSEENLKEMRLFTILTAIKLIIDLRIYTFVKTRANMQFFIENLNVLQENFLSVELSNLKIMTMKSLVSDTQRYKALGNGWTVAVIEHILREVFNA